MESNTLWESLSTGYESYGESHALDNSGQAQDAPGQEAMGQEIPGQEVFDYEILRDEPPLEPKPDHLMRAVDELQAAPETHAVQVDAAEGDDPRAMRVASPFALLVAPEGAAAAARHLAEQKHSRRRHSMDTKPAKPLKGELAEFDAAIDREDDEPEGLWGSTASRSATGMVAGLMGR